LKNGIEELDKTKAKLGTMALISGFENPAK